MILVLDFPAMIVFALNGFLLGTRTSRVRLPVRLSCIPNRLSPIQYEAE